MQYGIPVHRPRCLTFSNLPLLFGATTFSWSVETHAWAALRKAKNLAGPFDLCLGHFLYPHGLAAAQIGAALGIPAVVSLGESSFNRYEVTYDPSDIGQLLKKFSGIIANSSIIKEHCVQCYGLSDARIRIFPNGANEECFFPRDRRAARQQCQLPLDRPIIISVGHFIERKGPLRVIEAIRSRPDVGAVFLGRGPQIPKGPQVLYRGEVAHEEVPVWLSAADIFVLPTLDEGCSNAILEALFCGLPIVSSDLPFNHAILDDKVSILVDPHNVGALEWAISSLIDDPDRRMAMSKAALLRARSFRLSDRAKHILAFLSAMLTN
jgi:glycosyltransferase involved in cell wall biosynthesis